MDRRSYVIGGYVTPRGEPTWRQGPRSLPITERETQHAFLKGVVSGLVYTSVLNALGRRGRR